MARILSALLLALFSITAARASDFDRTPVLLVPGYGGAGSSFDGMRSYLVAHGYPSQFVRTITLVPGDGPNQAAAELQIAPAVESFLSDVNAFLAGQSYGGPAKSKVAILGWSMGAASSRWYVTKVAPERVERWIGLAGANHGTQCACDLSCGIPAPVSEPNGLEDLCPPFASAPGATVQFGLNGPPDGDVDETPYGYGADSPGKTSVVPDPQRAIAYFAMQASVETYIVPNASAAIDGAGGAIVTLPPGSPVQETTQGNFLVPGTDHVTIGLTSSAAFALVQALLEAPVPTPFCGDGIRTVGEACDDGPANGAPESCCSASCTPLPSGTECRPSSGVCDLAEICDGASGACPVDVGLPDADADSVCDAADICTNIDGGRTFLGGRPGTRLVLTKLNDMGTGNDGLRLSTTFNLPATSSFADVAPLLRGARLVLLNVGGQVISDTVLPPLPYQGAGSAGWRHNSTSTSWQYLDTRPIPLLEVQNLKLTDRSKTSPGQVRLSVVAKRATYPVQADDVPVGVAIVLGDATDSAAGRCGETSFAGGSCSFNGPGTTLSCRR